MRIEVDLDETTYKEAARGKIRKGETWPLKLHKSAVFVGNLLSQGLIVQRIATSWCAIF